MRKRALLFLLAAIFAVSLLPGAVFAASGNDSFASATVISANSQVSDSISAADDNNFYRFTLKEDGYITFSFSHEYVDKADAIWLAYLYTGNQEEIVWFDYPGNGKATTTSQKIALAAGTYYVKITRGAYYYSTKPYQLKVNFTASPDWETEWNNNFSEADVLTVGREKNGSLRREGDYDFYQVHLNTPGTLALSFSHDYDNNPYPCWHVTLHNQNREQLIEYTYTGVGQETTTEEKIGVPAGTYYIKVTHDTYFGYFSNVPYRVKMLYTASTHWEEEFNDSFETANPLVLGKEKYGSHMIYGDKDYYRLELSEPTSVTVKFSHPYDASQMQFWVVTLLNSNREDVFKKGYPGNANSPDVSEKIDLNKGTYYVRITHDEYAHITKPYSILIAAKSDAPKPEQPSKPTDTGFTDVPSNEYYAPAVDWALNHKPQITDGTSDTTFSPDATCTRGQVVTFLWRAMGCAEPKSTKNPFSDVKKSDYFYKAVLWAVENGITDGTSDTTFSPEDPCTRAHVVTFLWRAEHKPDAGSRNPFNDVASGQYYTAAVLWAVSEGITDGTSETAFSPEAPCTRGQIVTFLYRDMK